MIPFFTSVLIKGDFAVFLGHCANLRGTTGRMSSSENQVLPSELPIFVQQSTLRY